MSVTATNVFTATGRRKTATARVRLVEGSGKLIANGRDFENYFSHENFAKQAYAPLLTVELREKVDVTVNLAGGGVAGQAGATAHGIARALQKMNPELRAALEEGRAHHA
jgi:small subunit ribosomal protein S9